MKIPLSNYISLILQSALNYLDERILKLFNTRKNQFNKNNLTQLLSNRRNNLKKIIKERYGINNRASITDNILLEAIKLDYEYDEKKVKIIETNRKFIEYINTRLSNLSNYNKNNTTISTIIKNFRREIKNIRLDDSELEFIKYILDSSYTILKYNSNLIKIIE